jgi:beta-mannosidase
LIRSGFKHLFLLFLPLLANAQTFERSLTEQKWKFRKAGDVSWLSATVPGTVHTDLFKNKKIPDPFKNANEKQLQWIENEDWEYKTNLKISKEEFAQDHIELTFEGLDTYADVFLNDTLILSADNMFREWKMDVKKIIHPGKNELRLIFRSAVKKGKEEAKKLSYTLPGDEKVFVRKAQYQFGWDWGPRYVTCGIWKGVKLVFWKDARILDVQCLQRSLSDTLAELEFVCEIESDIDASAYIDITYSHTKDITGQRTRKIKLKKGINNFSVFYDIKNPQRWWTNDLGFPVMYSFRIDLSYDSRFLDFEHSHIGLRTLELMNEKDTFGSSFYFRLNGVPVFMKGANYIPQDNFLPRVSSKDQENMIKNARESNMNMLRVWGGGVYADDSFYDACDKNGILVWQDLMFACAMYPGDANFIENVAKEVEDQVRRLRNHPCLALWCGNNEIDEGWKNWGWQKQYGYSKDDSTKIVTDYHLLFENLFKDMFAINDPGRIYWPSSPSVGWGHKESLLEGDSHYWGVWWGMEPFEMYEQRIGRFVTEYGFQGMPALSTFSRMGMTPEALTFDSLTFKAHQKHPKGYETIRTYMEADYKVPVKFSDYAYVSQLLQARGMKIAIEAHRRAKPYCMGTLYWQMNDCWPVTSWSSIDYYGNWKASQYEVKRSYKDVIISVHEKKDSCEIYIVSDKPDSLKLELLMELFDLGGRIIWSKTIPVLIAPNSSNVHYKFDLALINKRDNNIVLKCTLLGVDGFSANANCLYYFAKPKELQLQRPQILIIEPFCDKEQCFSLCSDVLVKDVFISIEGEDIQLSDNYFDLFPNEVKTIYLPKGVRVKRLQKKIKIRSLIDTY